MPLLSMIRAFQGLYFRQGFIIILEIHIGALLVQPFDITAQLFPAVDIF